MQLKKVSRFEGEDNFYFFVTVCRIHLLIQKRRMLKQTL